MKNFLVLCRKTGQTTAFKRNVLSYTEENNLPIQWFFADHLEYQELLDKEKFHLVLLSPEVILYEKQIKKVLDERKIEHFTMKPVDFGLKRMEKLFPSLEPYIEN